MRGWMYATCEHKCKQIQQMQLFRDSQTIQNDPRQASLNDAKVRPQPDFFPESFSEGSSLLLLAAGLSAPILPAPFVSC